MGDDGGLQGLVVVSEVFDVEGDAAFAVGIGMDGGGDVVAAVELQGDVAEDGLFDDSAFGVFAYQLEDGDLWLPAGFGAGDAEGPAGCGAVAVPLGGDGADAAVSEDGVEEDDGFDGEVALGEGHAVFGDDEAFLVGAGGEDGGFAIALGHGVGDKFGAAAAERRPSVL